tara:strand:- start:2634 stop:3185 length:552 start_codon:yes stop_codon:yes gene_type:complete
MGISINKVGGGSTPVVAPYKVFTGLVTQSGGDDPQTITSGDLTIGVTYMMDGITLTTDFTNVGAPYNANGVYFVATGTTPNNWGVADLNYNTGSPTVTVLENTIGNVWFQYYDVGVYGINSNDLFSLNKTFILSGNLGDDNSSIYRIYINPNGLNSININTYFEGNISDYVLFNTPIEIRVYN